MKQPSFRKIEKLQADEFPDGSVELDDNGQIVIYTGFCDDKGIPEPTQPGYVVGKKCIHCGDPYERK